MKICLIRARVPEKEAGDTYYPLGTGYLAAYVERKLNGVKCIITDDFDKIKSIKPDLVGISATSTAFNSSKTLAEHVKTTLNVPVILGGYHITGLPNRLPTMFDVGVIGEGEVTFTELVKNYMDNGEFSNLQEINGILYHDEKGQLKTTKDRKLIKDLDTLPYPKRNIENTDGKDVPVFTSRGCPYNCVFCASAKHWGKFRQFSAEYVIKEIDFLVNNYDIKSILFYDDLFIADVNRFEKIANAIIEKGINEKITFHGFVRSNLVNDKVCFLLKKMGFSSIRFGAETGSEKLLKYLKNDSVSVKDHQRTIDTCKKYDLPVGGSFIFGTPGETLEDIEETKQFLRKNADGLRIMGFYILTPIPGTDIWETAKSEGHVSENEDMDWDKCNQDPRRGAFDWDNMIYLNEDNIPKSKFKEIVADIMQEFNVGAKMIKEDKQKCMKKISQ